MFRSRQKNPRGGPSHFYDHFVQAVAAMNQRSGKPATKGSSEMWIDFTLDLSGGGATTTNARRLAALGPLGEQQEMLKVRVEDLCRAFWDEPGEHSLALLSFLAPLSEAIERESSAQNRGRYLAQLNFFRTLVAASNESMNSAVSRGSRREARDQADECTGNMSCRFIPYVGAYFELP